MWCCAWSKRLFLCPVLVVLWLGRCGVLTRKDGSLPTLGGGPHAVAAPAIWTDLLGLFVLPLSHSVDRAAWVVSPRKRVSALLNASAAGESTTAGGLKAASLNASAASESTPAGGLEAFPLSELRWSQEEPVS